MGASLFAEDLIIWRTRMRSDAEVTSDCIDLISGRAFRANPVAPLSAECDVVS